MRCHLKGFDFLHILNIVHSVARVHSGRRPQNSLRAKRVVGSRRMRYRLNGLDILHILNIVHCMAGVHSGRRPLNGQYSFYWIESFVAGTPSRKRPYCI